jgi:RNA polymerase sigma-70 factor (ECF subfamily)
MIDDPDAALVLECRAGNRRAFEQLLVRYERPIFNAAFRILNHREDATDVTQTVFLKAYEHLDRFDPNQRFFSWIYRIAVNESMDMANGRRRAGSEVDVDALVSDSAGPDETASRDQLDAGMQAALMELKPDYRALIVLKHVQDCNYEDIAAILECPVKTVKSRLFTARQALRDVLLSKGLVAP